MEGKESIKYESGPSRTSPFESLIEKKGALVASRHLSSLSSIEPMTFSLALMTTPAGEISPRKFSFLQQESQLQ